MSFKKFLTAYCPADNEEDIYIYFIKVNIVLLNFWQCNRFKVLLLFLFCILAIYLMHIYTYFFFEMPTSDYLLFLVFFFL